jgi:mannose-6-phosphate isomerase-like protein (cupin superfamily)
MTALTKYTAIPSYITKDGSTIRELMHPDQHDSRHQSLAEAVVPPGSKTQLHRHQQTEEIYHITQGRGMMTLGDHVFAVEPGDTVVIVPNTPHCIENTAATDLHILCACSPAYSHDDTELLESES